MSNTKQILKTASRVLLLLALLGHSYAAPHRLENDSKEKRLLDEKSFTRLSVNWAADKEDKEKAQLAWNKISNWGKDGETYNRPLHVVYVAIKDRPPLKNYKDRLDRILKNIQAYYADQMQENGFPPLTFPLDLDESGKLIVHDAYLDRSLDSLDTHSSGGLTKDAANKVLKEKGINMEENHVLIVAQIPDKKGPYYGGGDFESGCCWICDAEHLDTLNFSSLQKGEYRFGTLGKDNTVYIGGTAHELGHCFGLPHTRESAPVSKDGTSLMGSGNYTYGQELREEGKGTFLIQSDAMRLASVPLFNGKKKIAADNVEVEFSDFNAKAVKEGLEISAIVKSQKVSGAQGEDKNNVPPVYGVVAYLDPEGGNDYDATTATAIPDGNGKFSLVVTRPGYEGKFELRLVTLLADGSTNTLREYLVLKKEDTDVSPLLARILLKNALLQWQKNDKKAALAELEKLSQEYKSNEKLLKTIQMWITSLKSSSASPDANNTPVQVPDDIKKVSLADMQPMKTKSGWGRPSWNVLPVNDLGPVPGFHDFTAPERFMYTHADGEFTYDLGGKWKNFTAIAGMPLPMYGNISVVVIVDDKEVYKSEPLGEGKAVAIKLDVSGAKTLSIQIKGNKGNDNSGNWGVIANPSLER